MRGNAQNIVESTIITAVARLSMVLALPTIGLLFWLYSGWQDTKLESLKTDLTSQIASAKSSSVAAQSSAGNTSEKVDDLNDRLVKVETKQAQDSANSEKFQNATLTRLDRLQDSIVGLSNTVSALTATIQAMNEDRRRRRVPP